MSKPTLQLVKAYAASPAAAPYRGTWQWRQLCCVAGALNIILLMTANLAGFVVGLDGIWPVLREALSQPKLVAIIALALFSAVQLMFHWRDEEEEAARAIKR